MQLWQRLRFCAYLSLLRAGKAALDDAIGLKDLSAVLIPDRDKGGTEGGDEPEDVEDSKMGVGKNTTSKSMDSGSEGGKYEEESKHGADFYPIPVREPVFFSTAVPHTLVHSVGEFKNLLRDGPATPATADDLPV